MSLIDLHNRFMIGFDVALGTAALAAPERTLELMGHDPPSEDAAWLFRRNGTLWLTFAAAHAAAAARGDSRDWWALAWLRGAELLTDVLWSRSPGFRTPLARATLVGAGVANLAMTLAFRSRARR